LKSFARLSIVLLTVTGLCHSSSLQATSDYCGLKKPQNFVGLKIGGLDQAQLDTTPPAQVEISTRELNSVWVFEREQRHTRSVGFNFRYTIVDLESLDAMTNGHLHTWDFPVEGRLSNTGSELYYNITPAISVSSNGLKNPELIDGDGLQLRTGMVYKKSLSLKSAWLLGFRSDHRFGSYKAYPVIGVCMQAGKDWNLQLALPDFSIMKRIGRKMSLRLFAEPVGNQWHVFSKDIVQESDFTYDAIATGLSAQWQVGTSMNVSLIVENQSDRRLNFVLDDNTVVEAKVESSRGMMLKGEVLF
jgi:hypothetical protein